MTNAPTGPGFVNFAGYTEADALLSVGKGWAPLVSAFFRFLSPNSRYRDVRVVQVKEKFGELRMYVDGGDDYLRGILDGITMLSRCVCEDCGNGATPRSGNAGMRPYWIVTLCDACKTAREEASRAPRNPA